MNIITFGEVMLRLMPEDFLRIRQAVPGSLEATFGGGELNVAVSIANQGGTASFVTVVPDNTITDALEQELRKLNVDCANIVRHSKGRFGIYFVETGANQRPGTVLYDRNGTAIALQSPDEYNWNQLLHTGEWFHVTGITPAISVHAAQATLQAMQTAKQLGLTISCDLNFRSKLWKWNPDRKPVELAQDTMRELVPLVDILIANEEDIEKTLGISDQTSNVEAGQLSLEGYRQVAREVAHQFPNVKKIAITLRESLSASDNRWGALLYDAELKQAFMAPLDHEENYQPYAIKNIVDRVGAGDAFAGGLLFALNTAELSAPETAIRYATAASCLKHSIKGDFNHVSRDEIESLMNGSQSGRVQR